MKLTDRTRIALIAAAIAVQLFVTLSLLFYTGRVRSHALKSGSIVSLACKAYDPFSPFKGRYVRLTFEQADIAREQLDDESREHLAETRGKKVFCRMQEGVDGIWTVSGIRRTHPQDGNVYIEVKNRWYSDTKVSLSYAFSEYYMQENYARLVDRIQWNDFNALEPVLSLYVGKDGRCVQKGLSVLDEGERIPIEEYCRRRLR